MPHLPKGTSFHVPLGTAHKYTAVIPTGPGARTRRVSFGHRDYEHYKDSVPASLGGQKWKHKNHMDTERRRRYRARHGALRCHDGTLCKDIKYSPAWFSWHFLW